MWCRFKPESGKFEGLNQAAIYKMNNLSAVYRIASQSIRLSMLNFVGRIFFPVVHGILPPRATLRLASVRLPGEEHETLQILGLIESCLLSVIEGWLTIKEY